MTIVSSYDRDGDPDSRPAVYWCAQFRAEKREWHELESRPPEWRSAGTGLCSYRVRGVDDICAEHLAVESYTVFICQQSYLLSVGIPSPTHSFFPGLKPSFSTNHSHCSPSFLLLLKYLLRGFTGLFTVISQHICFLRLVFLFLHIFSCRFRAVD